MAHPALALLLAGKMDHHADDGEGEDMQEDPHEMKLDAVRHLIAAVHSKKEEDVLECLENLFELCRDDDKGMEEEPDMGKDEEEAPEEDGDSY